MNEPFFLTLNSNAEGEYKEHNSSASFRTHLGKMLFLENAWEMALVELKVPMTLPNIPQDICRITRHTTLHEHPFSNYYHIRHGSYNDATALIIEINKVLDGEMKLTLDKNNYLNIEVVRRKLDEAPEIFYFDEKMGKILGLEERKITNKQELYTGVRPVRPNLGICSTLNINANIIEHQLVDNSHSALLRSVSTHADKYSYLFDKHYNFTKLHYKKLNCNRLEHIEINISNESNEQVSFGASTSTSVLLHFRRCIE